MNELRICFEVHGLAVDENGLPCPAGMQISFGQTEKEINYKDLVESISIPGVLHFAALESTVKPEDVKIITPEEYDERYGDRE